MYIVHIRVADVQMGITEAINFSRKMSGHSADVIRFNFWVLKQNYPQKNKHLYDLSVSLKLTIDEMLHSVKIPQAMPSLIYWPEL